VSSSVGLARRLIAALCLAATAVLWPEAASGQDSDYRRLALELEVGPVWQSRNDAQVPNDNRGTRFALDEITGSGAFAAARLYAEWRPGRRHGLRLLAAPLSLSGSSTLTGPVEFDGTRFEAGLSTKGSYRFDSYRLTYRFRLVENPVWLVDLGLTAKLRSAEIGLEQQQASASYSNTGVVPLLYAAVAWRPAPGWSVALDADGAAASQGRAFDVSLKLYRDLSGHWSVGAGYRTLEGGADVDDVFTFAWFHYAAVSVVYRF